VIHISSQFRGSLSAVEEFIGQKAVRKRTKFLFVACLLRLCYPDSQDKKETMMFSIIDSYAARIAPQPDQEPTL
jgi:hypothetical protein